MSISCLCLCIFFVVDVLHYIRLQDSAPLRFLFFLSMSMYLCIIFFVDMLHYIRLQDGAPLYIRIFKQRKKRFFFLVYVFVFMSMYLFFVDVLHYIRLQDRQLVYFYACGNMGKNVKSYATIPTLHSPGKGGKPHGKRPSPLAKQNTTLAIHIFRFSIF